MRHAAARLEVVARVLRNRPGVTAAELARELGVSIRSVFRDLDTLRARGYPIESSRGRGGGLRLHQRWSLGTVRITPEEGLCTLLSLAIAEKLGLPIFAPEAARARRKVADAFPQDQRRRLAPLRERIFIGQTASPAVRASYTQPAGAPMRRLQVAFVEQRVIRAEYRREDGATTERRVEPHALVINWPAWYLLAFDCDRAAPRTFRFDRFLAVHSDAAAFRPRPREIARELLEAHGVVLEHV
jgi:predicted DNA-binding transcriptional regulator YafY